MHELPVSQSILDISLRHAEKAGARRITAINLVIGRLTGFVDDSIQFYFDFLSKDTPAEGARLGVEHVEPKARCRACGADFEPPDSHLWTCPACGALGSDVIAGREFFVASIEVE